MYILISQNKYERLEKEKVANLDYSIRCDLEWHRPRVGDSLKIV